MLLYRKDLIYPDLSYKIVGILFEVYNQLGPGHQEKYYQKVLANAFKQLKIKFQEQVKVDLKFQDVKIGLYFLDFLIEDKIILEINKGDRFSKYFFDQINAYLQASKLKLALLVNFSTSGLKFKKIVNLK
jgi:GxxExxY protein